MLKTSCRKCGRRCGWARGVITLVEWMPGLSGQEQAGAEDLHHLTESP